VHEELDGMAAAMSSARESGLIWWRHTNQIDFRQNQRCAMCSHRPQCPSADSADRGAAHTVSAHPEQGWSLLCNGVVVFDDLGSLLPDGRTVVPAVSSRIPAARTPVAA
jgi:hypothetical protein